MSKEAARRRRGNPGPADTRAMEDAKSQYHTKETCNKCGARANSITVTDRVAGNVCECETTCTTCGHEDYWAYGFFMSAQAGLDACEKYTPGRY